MGHAASACSAARADPDPLHRRLGLDLELRAITEEPALLELARRSEEHGEELAFLERHLFSGPVYGPAAPDEIHRAFTQVAARMRQGHPGIESRCLSLHRAWDALHYLLSPARRAGESLADDLGTWAIRGSDPVGGFASGCQGVPLRYTPKEKAAEVSVFLDDLRKEHLRAHWDPQQMERMSVYKLWADREESFDAYWESIEGLRAFHRAVRQARESVLVVLD